MSTHHQDESTTNWHPPLASDSRLVKYGLIVGVVSLIATLLGLGAALWLPRGSDPEVTFEAISDTNVFDVHRRLEELTILFRDQDVQEQNLNLKVLTIQVSNSGGLNILESHYDSAITWGIKFSDGELVDARVINSNSDFLWSRVEPQVLGVDTIAFKKVTFDKKKYFIIEALLLHSKDARPSFTATGKIAGIDEFNVIARPLPQEETDFFTQVFAGDFDAHLSRAIIYVTIYLIGVLVLIRLLIWVVIYYRRWNFRRRERNITRSQVIRQLDDNRLKNFLVDYYGKGGASVLVLLQELMAQPNRMFWMNTSENWTIPFHHQINDQVTTRIAKDVQLRFLIEHALADLVKLGYLNRGSANEALFDSSLCQVVDEILKEVKS